MNSESTSLSAAKTALGLKHFPSEHDLVTTLVWLDSLGGFTKKNLKRVEFDESEGASEEFLKVHWRNKSRMLPLISMDWDSFSGDLNGYALFWNQNHQAGFVVNYALTDPLGEEPPNINSFKWILRNQNTSVQELTLEGLRRLMIQDGAEVSFVGVAKFYNHQFPKSTLVDIFKEAVTEENLEEMDTTFAEWFSSAYHAQKAPSKERLEVLDA